MATYNDLELEKTAAADKYIQRKANSLGADGSILEEPFGLKQIILREDIFSETPTAETNFAYPEYRDASAGGGNIASRHVQVRLHPLVVSGKSGNNSIQTFVAVRSAPASDHPDDIEAVRIKHLIPPDLSPGRASAGESDVNYRGFELALYPAYSVNDRLEAYDGYGPIPTSADPTSAYGVGGNGRWTVDYANGIIRFSGAPLNGITGIVNPFNVYGDINGHEITAANGGRITLFATFYEYVGPTLIDPDDVGVVVVGDGYHSFGHYYGKTNAVMQQAVDSLATYGGTILLKEGRYEYENSVYIPENVRIVGLSKNAEITKPNDGAAFIISGSNSSIEGVTIKSDDTSTGGDIEIITTVETDIVDGSRIIDNVTIKNNTLWATADAYGIGFAPGHLNAQFNNINIEDNVFEAHSSEPVYIAERLNGGSLTLKNLRIHGNDFGTERAKALYINGTCVEDIIDLHFTDNHSSGKVDVIVDTGVMTSEIYIANNSEFENISINEISGAIIENNIFSNINLDGYVVDSQFRNNVLYTFSLLGTASSFTFTGNNCLGEVLFNGDQPDTEGLLNVIISNNVLYEYLRVSHYLSTTGNYLVDNLIIEDNRVLGLTIANGADLGAGSSITYSNLIIRGNTIGDGERRNVVELGLDSASQADYINQAIFDGNTLYGDVNIYDNVQFRESDNGLRFVNNTFDIAARGLYLHGHILNHLDVSNNKIAHVVLFESDETLSSNLTNYDIVIKDNVISTSGSIILKPEIDASGGVTLEMNGLSILGNVFENTGSISVLAYPDTSQDYDLVDVFISDNELASGDIVVVSTKLSSSSTTNMIIKNNYVGRGVSIGGGAISQLHISGNKIISSLGVTENITDLTFNANIVNDIRFDGTITNAIISDNMTTNASGGFGFKDQVTDIVMTGNNIDGYFTADGSVYGSTFNSNKVAGTFDLNNTAGDSTFSDNVFAGDVDFVGAVSNIIFTNNDAYGLASSIYFHSSIDNSIISGNLSLNDVLVSGGVSESKIDNNKFLSMFTLSSNVSDSSLNGNSVDSDFLISGRARNVSLDHNIVGGQLTINDSANGTKENLTVSNNIIYGATEISGNCLRNSIITSNRFMSTFETASSETNTWEGVMFSDNSIADTTTLESILESTITGNRFSGVLVFEEFIDNSAFSNNIISSGVPSIDFQGAISDFTFTGNRLFSSVEFDSTVGTSSFTGNQIDGSVMFSGAVTETSFGDNVLESTLTFASTSDEVTLGNNVIEGQVLVTGNTSYLVVTGNRLNALTSIDGTLTNSVLNNNKIYDFHVNNNVEDTTIGGNNISTSMSFAEYLSTCQINNNIVVGQFGVNGYITDSNISENKSETFIVGGTITGSVLSSNIFEQMQFGDDDTTSELLNSSVQDNIITQDGYMNIYTKVHGSKITDNRVLGETSFYGEIIGAEITDNKFDKSLFLGSQSNSLVFTSNSIAEAITIHGKIYDSVITSNIIGGEATFDDDIASTILSSNNFDGYTSSCTIAGSLRSSKFINNIVREDMQFGEDSTSYEIVSSILSDNIFNTLSVYMTSRDAKFSDNKVFGSTMFYSEILGSEILDNSLDGYTVFNSQIENTPFVGNSISGETIFTRDFTESQLMGNMFNDDVSLLNSVHKATISGNEFDGYGIALYFGDNITNTSITGNRMQGGSGDSEHSVRFEKLVKDTSFIGNAIMQSVLVVTGGENLIFNDNIFTALTIAGQLTNASIIGNYIDDLQYTSTSAVTSVVISNNVIQTGITFTSATPTKDGVVITNNIGSETSVLSIAGTMQNGCVISSNKFGVLTLSTLTDVNVNGNQIAHSTLSTLGTLTSCNIIGNNFEQNGITISSMSDCTFSNNIFAGTTTITTQISDSTVSENAFDAMTISGTTNAILDSTVSGNRFSGAFDMPSTDAELRRSNFVNNRFESTTTLRECYNSNVDNNVFTGVVTIEEEVDHTSFNNNNFIADLDFNGTVQYSTISNNIFDSTIVPVAFSYIRFIGNTVDSAVAFLALTECNIADNIFMGDVDISTVSSSIVSDNIFSGATVSLDFTSTVTDSLITGNKCQSEMEFSGAVESSIISNNTIHGVLDFVSSLDGSADVGCVVSGNVVEGGASFSGTLTNVSVEHNSFGTTTSGAVTFSAALNDVNIIGNDFIYNVTFPTANCAAVKFNGNGIGGTLSSSDGDVQYDRMSVSGNNLEGAVTIRARFNDSVISDNIMGSNFLVDHNSGNFAVNESVISGNKISGNFEIQYDGTGTAASLYDSVFSSNVVDGTTTIEVTTSTGDQAALSSVIKGNKFGDAVSITSADSNTPTLDGCVLEGNVFESTLSVTNTDSGGGVFRHITFNNNVCLGAVTFNAASNTGNSTFEDGTFNGNVFDGGIVFGNSATARNHAFTRVIVNGNSGGGGVTFYTTGSANLSSSIIIGNGMGGNLTISGGGTYASPPASGDPMVALNNFAAYSGITFTDAASVGWGDNTAGAGTNSDIYGSNL